MLSWLTETDAHTSSSNATSTSDNLTITDDIPDEVLRAISNETVDSDALIAQMLQMQYDKEYDNMLKRTEEKYNGDSKVSISFENFKRTPENFGKARESVCASKLFWWWCLVDFESDDEEEIEDIRDRKDWDRFDSVLRDLTSIPVCGYKVSLFFIYDLQRH